MAPPNQTKNCLPGAVEAEQLNHFQLRDGKLTAGEISLLHDVPGNVSFTPYLSLVRLSESDAPPHVQGRVLAAATRGGFIGFAGSRPSERLENSLGKFTGREFVSVFRFKTWWSTMWVGRSGSDLQMETQWVLLNVPEINSYAVIIPIIEDSFRSALQSGGQDGEVLICAESGSTKVKRSSFDAIAYVHMGENPYELMKEAYSAIRVHLNTFRLLEEKTVPGLVDKFGWCTWDAFYLLVEPIGIWHGVEEFHQGGVSPRFLIIDDGWQSISFDDQKNPEEGTRNLVLGGTQMTARLYRFEDCNKFKLYKRGLMLGPNAPSFDPRKPKKAINKAIELEHAEKDLDRVVQSGATSGLADLQAKIERLKAELDEITGSINLKMACAGCCLQSCGGMKAFTSDLRTKFEGLDDIYVWHALCGAWGGVRPGSTPLDSKVINTKLSPGLDGTMEDLAVVKIVEGGIGLVNPCQANNLYDAMHSYLADAGITGVKVDVIHCLEYVSEDFGGRVNLAKEYYKGLTNSLIKNFKGSGLISSMQQCNDFFFLGTRQISMGRVGDDFWFQDPNGDPMGVYWLQGVHMIHCTYNSMWMGQIIQPDWDMFQSDHLCAKFHAGSRAICGGPVYVSDSVGGHDFDLIGKLVFPDGTIPKCIKFALPTRDCLFKNPLFNDETALKIWNLNKYGGVIGAFNCQGAGWDPKEKRIKGYSRCYHPISASVRFTDVEWDQHDGHIGPVNEFAVYLSQAEKLLLKTTESGPIDITIQPSSFEIFTFVPLQSLGGSKFSPIGLTNMFNSGGTIQSLVYREDGSSATVRVKGGGNFLAYSSKPPRQCFANGREAPFRWSDGALTVDVPWDKQAGGVSTLEFIFLS
ncbi:hypothetical protein MLD38_040605 [Melastoma candidum]|nr:hypothetical protein MLD38_040605 [Melastoma candidum]